MLESDPLAGSLGQTLLLGRGLLLRTDFLLSRALKLVHTFIDVSMSFNLGYAKLPTTLTPTPMGSKNLESRVGIAPKILVGVKVDWL